VKLGTIAFHDPKEEFVNQVLASIRREHANGYCTRRGLIAEELGCSTSRAGEALRVLLARGEIRPAETGWYCLADWPGPESLH
jgi:hypothetical protein